MSFRGYPKYKESGIEWLGQVPQHWEATLLKRAFQSVDYGISESLDSDGEIAILRMGNIENGRVVMEALKYVGSVDPALLLRRGDLLYNRTNSLDLIGKVGMFQGNTASPVSFASYLVRLRTVDESFPGYFAYLLNTAGILGLARANAFVAIGQCNLNPTRYGEIPITIPPKEEQCGIAFFLDQETAKIDGLLQEQRLLIELLREKRQSVISHAITKGLTPHTPLKPSNIEWLGKVPQHWDVRRLSSLSSKITNGYVGPTRDILTDAGVRYLQSLHIKGNLIRFDVPYFVSENWSKRHEKSILEAGDVLIVQTGDIGQVAVVPEAFAGCNCHALIIVAPIRNEVSGDWVSWSLNSDYGLHTLLSIQTGALHPHLNCGDVKDIFIPLPPKTEQHRIVEYILEKTGRFDALINEAQQTIELLQERRTALISAAVTGKIDVRGTVEKATA